MIDVQTTPNPNVMKFLAGVLLEEGGPYDFDGERDAKSSPLAQAIFGQNGVLSVFIAKEFVSVRKHEGVGWEPLRENVMRAIRAWQQSGEVAVDGSAMEELTSADPEDVESRIRTILDRDIRPAVAMDGGDIVLQGFDDGVVTVQLRGACSGCPSSTATLKMGVERRLLAAIPEVRQVVAVAE